MDKKILLIEDDLFISQLYQRVLTQANYKVLVAMDGQVGLEKALEKPDLILLDIMLPKLNGIAVLERLKADEKTKDIPVVLLTNLGQENIILKTFRIGAQGYLMKMRVTPYEITGRIKNYIENPSFKMPIDELNLD